MPEAELWIVIDTQYAGTRVNFVHRVHRSIHMSIFEINRVSPYASKSMKH